MLRIFLRERHAVRYTQFLRPFSTEKSLKETAKEPGSVPDEPESLLRRMHTPSDFDKKMLVWVGRYKTTDEVPRSIPVETIERAKNKGRIKLCNYMILATIVGCLFMAWSGKQAAHRGESIQKMNEDWHKAVKEGKA